MRLAAYGPDGAGEGPAHRSEPPVRSMRRWGMRPAVVARVGLALAALAVLVGVGGLLTGAWGTGGPTTPERPALPLPRGSPGASGPSAAPAEASRGAAEDAREATATQVYVHVAGQVADPGLYQLDDGARVAAAIEAAGGAVGQADLSRVNLAAHVSDGQQIYVPATGEPARPGAAGEPGAGPAAEQTVVNVNTAPAATLETLPGIGPSRAQDLIRWRTENGPFESVEDLLQVPGIGPATLERLREQVRV